MDFKVIFKDSFIEDLEQIVRRIATDDSIAARNGHGYSNGREFEFFPGTPSQSSSTPGREAIYCEEILQGFLPGVA